MIKNRRTLLTGLGGPTVGGGAVLGSGAFSSLKATRSVEVNVLTNNQIGDSDEYADILSNVGGKDTAAAEDSNGTIYTDGTTPFPDNARQYYGAEGDVSLLQNDVNLVFSYQNGGTDNRLLSNATVQYRDLSFLVDTRSGATEPTDGKRTLSFNNATFSGDTALAFPDGGPTNKQVSANAYLQYDVSLATDSSDDPGTAVLELTIE